jgi:hypothetical protein
VWANYFFVMLADACFKGEQIDAWQAVGVGTSIFKSDCLPLFLALLEG